jgi:hypothetical protein
MFENHKFSTKDCRMLACETLNLRHFRIGWQICERQRDTLLFSLQKLWWTKRRLICVTYRWGHGFLGDACAAGITTKLKIFLRFHDWRRNLEWIINRKLMLEIWSQFVANWKPILFPSKNDESMVSKININRKFI